MNGGGWWATVHGVTKSWTQLSNQTTPPSIDHEGLTQVSSSENTKPVEQRILSCKPFSTLGLTSSFFTCIMPVARMSLQAVESIIWKHDDKTESRARGVKRVNETPPILLGFQLSMSGWRFQTTVPMQTSWARPYGACRQVIETAPSPSFHL